MAKKSLFEKLGLVEGVAASEYDMPDTTNELRVCSGVGDHYVSNDFGTSSPLINNTDEEFVSSETDLGDPLEWKINKK